TSHGRDVFHMVQAFREWNAEHGGVYVLQTPASPPNPYLDIPKRDLQAKTGEHLTLINPAYMTRQLAEVIGDTAGGLLLLFIFLAAAMALIDQLIARREFARQMRMSRREITREHREREGEPRQKQKRRQILGEIIKQAAAAANVKGADVLIVNPTHYAVALRYRPEEGNAPIVQARGRNLWARRMRDTARREGIVIVRNPALARALYNEGQIGRPIGQANFVPVADIYIALQRALREASKP
ncbi:MAG: EscU/YscU/HrcU family type III secretion system export apparatus switch protein, partial [Sphingomonadales bacterium]|nr:EscU/YscU/HrcU family type III secretion system export apparatus switch protein [Sphingomonadales bacterium]